MNIQREIMKLEIVLEEEEDGTFSVHCPALKGCHSQGKTKEEALTNIKEAIQLYLEVANEKARAIIVQYPKSIAIEMAV
jgi:predicted RNase H-like HicB family nuclease